MGTAYGGNIWSGGTVFSANDRPGGPFLGGDRVQRDRPSGPLGAHEKNPLGENPK